TAFRDSPRRVLDLARGAGARLRRRSSVARAGRRDSAPAPRADRARAGALRPAAPVVPLPERPVRRALAVAVVAALALPGAASAHPRPVPPSELSTHWIAPPAVVVLAAVAIALFVQAA